MRRNRFTGKLMPPREGESVNNYIMKREETLRQIEAMGEGMIRASIDTVLRIESKDFMLIGPDAGAELRRMVYGTSK